MKGQDVERSRQLRSRLIEILNVAKRFLEIGISGGDFPFAKIHCTGEQLHKVRWVPPPVSIYLRPRWTAPLNILQKTSGIYSGIVLTR